MIPRKLILIFIVFISFLVEMATANCYFIRLNGYHIDQRFDVFGWGELSPLIGLETGEYFNLSPHGQDIIDIANGKAKNLQGELYYIPQNMIDKNNQFSLKMMVIERDTESTDDLVLPLSERSISLVPKSFVMDSLRTDVSFQTFGDPTATIPQYKQSYQFEILRDSQDCSPDTAEGRSNDLYFRLENRLKQLHLHILHYEKKFLSGGQEYKSYRIPNVQEKSFSKALNIAQTIASINSAELISLGMRLEKLSEVENFKNVWREYRYLVQRLLKQKITFLYAKEKKWTKMEVPSLRFHPDWKNLSKGTGILPPEHWKIPIDK